MYDDTKCISVVGPGVKLEPWSIVVSSAGKTGNGLGVKHLARIASRPVTWVIKIKHAGLGVLGHFRIILNYLGGWAR